MHARSLTQSEQDEALTNAINDCLQPFVTKGEEYIHGWHCIKVQRRASSPDERRLTVCLACSSFRRPLMAMQVNFRGQAQERIVVLTDCAVYTFAYDFAKNKIDDSRVHRHLHEHFKHITYGARSALSLSPSLHAPPPAPAPHAAHRAGQCDV
jgi:hypothetical protein